MHDKPDRTRRGIKAARTIDVRGQFVALGRLETNRSEPRFAEAVVLNQQRGRRSSRRGNEALTNF